MRRSILILMLDVMVLSVLSLQAGKSGGARMIVPAQRWNELISKGLEKEEKYMEELAKISAQLEVLESQLAVAVARADLASEEASNAHAQIARLEREKATAQERAKQAEKQVKEKAAEVDAARKRADEALVQAEASRKREENARSAAAAAAGRAEEAAKQVLSARERELVAAKQAAVAAEKSRSAALQAEEARKRAADARSKAVASQQRETKALAEAQKAEEAARTLEIRAKLAEQRMKEARAAEAVAKAKHDGDRDRLREAIAREASAIERAKLSEERLSQAERAAAESGKKADGLGKQLTEAMIKQKEVQTRAEWLTQDKKRLEAKLAAIEKEQRQSVWVRRDKLIRRLKVTIYEGLPIEKARKTENEFYFPLVQIDGQVYLVADFRGLNFDLSWWQGRQRTDISGLAVELGTVGEEPGPVQRLSSPFFVSADEPRVCYLACPDKVDDGFAPVGMQVLKEKKIQQGILFKAGEPDKTLKVSFTPALGTEHVLVRALEPESGIKIETGDYLLTDRGYYIGVMTSDTECYVVPSELPDRTRRTMIPVTKPVNEVYYKAFAEGLIKVRQMIKGDPGRAAAASGKSG